MTLQGLDLSGKIAVVTGAGEGIGAATAQLLARCGADIVLAGRTLETLKQRADAITAETGRRCLCVPTDVRKDEQVKHLIARTKEAFGRFDILINNAGGARPSSLKKLTPDLWHGNFALNVDAACYCSVEAIPHFIEQGFGSIVNVSSVAGVSGTMGVGAYASAKAALQMFTKVAAAEWGPHGIRVNCVAAGMTATEKAMKSWAKGSIDVEAASKLFPLRRAGTPEEVANAIVFLASDAASYITGETLVVGGGPQMGGYGD